MKKLQYLIAKGLKIILNPPALNACTIHKTAKVCARSELNRCSMDRYSYVGNQCFMVNVKVGAFCSIADRCSIGGARHPIEYVSTSPVFHEGKNIMKKNFSTHAMPETPQTIIENDVWIGQGAFIKAGIKISNGAVIGMGSVVTKDVGPYEIWAGNPAKKINDRFDQDIKEKLLNSKWWEMDEKTLEKYAKYFNDPETFINNSTKNVRE